MKHDRRPKVPRRSRHLCLFCGSRADSAEHVVAQQLARALGVPKRQVTEHLSLSYAQPDPSASGSLLKAQVVRRTGLPSSRREKVVCRSCNNGWMERLETRAVPLLSSLARGETVELGEEDQKLLALWADKTAIVWEAADEKPLVSTIAHRTGLRRNQLAMPTSKVWIGAYSGQQWLTMPKIADLHAFFPAYPMTAAERAVVAGGAVNFRVTIIVVGQLVLHVSYGTTVRAADSPSPSVDARIWGGLERIHSYIRPVRWPSARRLDDEDVMDLVGQRNRRFWGPFPEHSAPV